MRPASAAVVYSVTALGDFKPSQVNDQRDVVGNRVVAGVNKPALWLPQPKYGLPAGVNDLSTQTGFNQDSAAGINNLGQIVGTGHSPPQLGSQRPVTWNPSGGWSLVDSVFGDVGRVNDAGEMAGHYHSIEQAAVWLPAPAHGLPAGRNVLSTNGWGFANDINAAGQVAGRDFDPNTSANTPFLYLPEAAYGRPAGVNVLTGTGVGGGATNADATAINGGGHVVGGYRTQIVNGILTDRAFVWRPNTTVAGPAGFFDLGGVPADATYWSLGALDVNDTGQVIGFRTIKTPAMTVSQTNAFLWTRTGGMVDLNTLIDPNAGWVLRDALSINAGGDIVGTGTFNGVNTAYMLTVPEPAVTGVVALVLVAPRRRRRSRDV